MAKLDHRKAIAIDGPAAAGKSTVAQLLADQLGVLIFDTGALYRAVTLSALRDHADLADGQSLADRASKLNIALSAPSRDDGRLADVRLDGEDVSWAIREPDIDANVSQVAAHPEVRDALLPTQRENAAGAAVILVGRDIGTVVLPDAGTKFYLDASVEERARRRYQDMRAQGADMEFASVLEELRERDYKDSSRATAPLRAADDAVRVDTDGLSIEDIVASLERTTRARWDELT